MSGQAGSVHLVGAGPGDPALITRRGEELLRRADVILFDRLVDQRLLDVASPCAERIDVVKAPPGVQGTRTAQSTINDLLVDRARRGLVVVRLKGGDPFVFGRGSEEMEACRAAGVACEVVPGVTSAIAGPAVAGIPVTARGLARGFAVVSARGGDDAPEHFLDFEALARMDTVVVLMGRERLEEVVDGLLAAGRSSITPAALVERATCPDQRAVFGTLGTIVDDADRCGIEPPAVLVVGPTARPVDASYGTLRGRRLLVTRPRSASSLLVAELRARGAEVIECPLIRVQPAHPLPDRLDLSVFDWLVFTSLHGVRGFAMAMEDSGLDSRSLGGLRIAAVGPRTAAELWDALRVRPELVPKEHRASALIEAFLQATRHDEDAPRVLFPCGTLAREELAVGLRRMGVEVTEMVVYHTLLEAPGPAVVRALARLRGDGEALDAVLLYSPSAVRSLVEHGLDIGSATLVCVGPTTAAAVRAAGLGQPLVVPSRYGDAGVIEVLERLLSASPPAAQPQAQHACEGGPT